MKYRTIVLVLLALVSATSFAQQSFTISMAPLALPNAPGLHSFSWGMTSDSNWVLLGGRVDGLHQRQPFAAFQPQDNNQSVYVVDPVAQQVWSASLSSLPAGLYEQLQATNQQFQQRNSTLYVVGGYGFSATANDHITYPNLTAIDLDGLAAAVTGGQSIAPYFRQITDGNLKVTGGQLGLLDSTFYLVGGQLFDGRYNPMGPNHGPGFTQQYTNQIRSFQIADDGTHLALVNYQAATDAAQLHRRDYNMVPQIFPSGDLGFTAFSGVFDANDMPFLNSVDITGPTQYFPNHAFNQYLSQYHSAKVPVYDRTDQVMHTLFFGGMSQFTLDSAGNLVEDANVPFVRTISRVSRDASGAMQEIDLGYIEMPALLGAGAEFIPSGPHYLHGEILDLDSLPVSSTRIGYIVGGIESTAPHIFFSNNGSQSSASPVIYEVFLHKGATGREEQAIQGENVFHLEAFPSPARNHLFLQFRALAFGEVSIALLDREGRRVRRVTHPVDALGPQQCTLDVSALPSGLYFIEVSNGVDRQVGEFLKW